MARVFGCLDKQLKRYGNKQLVLEVAKLSVSCARRVKPRTTEVVADEARALICGTSWVYQRVGQLDKARADATKSEWLARNAGLHVSLAFCLKCRGRLCRMRAEERKARDVARISLLKTSERLLRRAIKAFSALRRSGFGPEHAEVGDCYSLLGSTYLVGGDTRKAHQAALRASELITDTQTKDYLDLLILRGNIALRKGNYELATSWYTTAIEAEAQDDPERSEMRARATFRRGTTHRLMGNASGAAQDFRHAREIWARLHEDRPAAEAEWEEILVRQRISEDAIDVLCAEEVDALIRVATVRIHEERVPKERPRVAQRPQDPGPTYWRQLLIEARQRVAADLITWD